MRAAQNTSNARRLEAEFREIGRALSHRASLEPEPRYRPLRVEFHLAAPVAVSHPFIFLDSLLGHCLLLEYLGEGFYDIWSVKTSLGPYMQLEKFPVFCYAGLNFASVGIWQPESVRARTIMLVKRFEERFAPGKGRVHRGSGFFRDYAMRRVYIPAHSVVFYVRGDRAWIERLLQHVPGLGDDVRIGFGTIRDISITELEQDKSLVDGDLAMRPIPVDMLEDYEETIVMAWKPPYWDAANVALCCAPFTRVHVREDIRRFL